MACLVIFGDKIDVRKDTPVKETIRKKLKEKGIYNFSIEVNGKYIKNIDELPELFKNNTIVIEPVYTCWDGSFTVEASTIEEAKKKIMEIYKQMERDEHLVIPNKPIGKIKKLKEGVYISYVGFKFYKKEVKNEN